ncbi:MAG TPA: hypothetical protein PLY52_04315 [Methanothrix sp.]|jgi:hypothetical protein|uniref:hypothetical protein n=1 Tax=Methanothrix sp. TaxID=90426 RepID=UPI002D0D337A|nr:hypothetical protein [Methanothrix sp.]MDI9416730.1 hypothetical protein [Euryarchaeota archaeon]HON35520.1 hypothetical protein [Methanothrix sp.]HRU74579.1 hypothetical protein [Methanothrix sp.]
MTGGGREDPPVSPLVLCKEKFFKEDVQLTLMKKINKDCSDPPARGSDECYLIAESMIDELHQIAFPERISSPLDDGRHKGSFKSRILQQIRNARRFAMLG